MFHKQFTLTAIGCEITLGTGKSHVKEVRTEIENESDHVNVLVIGPGIVIIEMIGTTETGIGIGTETGKGGEREIADVIEIEHVVVTVIVREIVIETENVIVIEKGIGIMKLGKLIGDDHMIGGVHMVGRLITIMLNLNMRRHMNLKMILGGTTNLCTDIGMQILNMILTTMSIAEEGGSMMMEMTMVAITIIILIMIGWKMTVTLNGQHLNPVKRR